MRRGFTEEPGCSVQQAGAVLKVGFAGTQSSQHVTIGQQGSLEAALLSATGAYTDANVVPGARYHHKHPTERLRLAI